jgi:hypothetical protein
VPSGIDRQPIRAKLSPASPGAGMNCHPCVRNGTDPLKDWLLRLDSNQQPSLRLTVAAVQSALESYCVSWRRRSGIEIALRGERGFVLNHNKCHSEGVHFGYTPDASPTRRLRPPSSGRAWYRSRCARFRSNPAYLSLSIPTLSPATGETNPPPPDAREASAPSDQPCRRRIEGDGSGGP